MTSDEFAIWWDDYAGKFPATSRWVNDLGPDIGHRQLSLWASILDAIPLRDALRVNAAMARGTTEPVGRFDSDRERTGLIVHRVAVAFRRTTADTNRPTEPPPPLPPALRERSTRPEPTPFRVIIAKLERLIQSGRTHPEAVEEVMRAERSSGDELDGPRYDCRDCHDTGVVEVWSAVAMRCALTRTDLLKHPKFRSLMAVPCRCGLGRHRIWATDDPPPRFWRGWRSADVAYDPERYCVVMNGDTSSDDAVDGLVAWVRRAAERQPAPTPEQPALFDKAPTEV